MLSKSVRKMVKDKEYGKGKRAATIVSSKDARRVTIGDVSEFRKQIGVPDTPAGILFVL